MPLTNQTRQSLLSRWGNQEQEQEQEEETLKRQRLPGPGLPRYAPLSVGSSIPEPVSTPEDEVSADMESHQLEQQAQAASLPLPSVSEDLQGQVSVDTSEEPQPLTPEQRQQLAGPPQPPVSPRTKKRMDSLASEGKLIQEDMRALSERSMQRQQEELAERQQLSETATLNQMLARQTRQAGLEKVEEGRQTQQQDLQAELDETDKAWKQTLSEQPKQQVDVKGIRKKANDDWGSIIMVTLAHAVKRPDIAGQVLNNIERKIDQEVESQRQALAQARTDWRQKLVLQNTQLGRIQNRMKDVNASAALMKQARLEEAAGHAESLAAQARTKEEKQTYMEQAQSLQERGEMVRLDWRRQDFQQKAAARQAAAAAAARRQKQREEEQFFLSAPGKRTLKRGGVTATIDDSAASKVTEGSRKIDEQIAALGELDRRLSNIPEGTVTPEEGNLIRRGWHGLKSMWSPAWAASSKTEQERALSAADFDINSMAATAGELGVLRDTDMPRIQAARGGDISSRRALVNEWKDRAIAKRQARGD